MNKDDLSQLVIEFRRAESKLTAARAEMFPHHSIVRVDNPRFRGFGVVALDHSCGPDQLPVILENGNIWWYDITTCEREDGVVPDWVKRIAV